MTRKLFIALYVGLIFSMVVLFIAKLLVAWVFFGFLFLAIFGGIMLVNRPHIITMGFLAASLIVLGAGLFTRQNPTGDWITIIAGASMSALSAFTLFWELLHPEPTVKPVIEDKGYNMMNEQEFLHQVSVDTDVNIELLKDLYRNEKLWTFIRAGKIIDATVLFRSIQPRVGLREAKMVVEAFATRKDE